MNLDSLLRHTSHDKIDPEDNTSHAQHTEVEEKEFNVSLCNTLAAPDTMMVMASHADIAYVAMNHTFLRISLNHGTCVGMAVFQLLVGGVRVWLDKVASLTYVI